MRSGHSEGRKSPKVGVCPGEKSPRIRDSVRLARDTATFWFQPAGHIRGPNEPVSGPTDTVSGPHGPKHSQKATQTLLKLIMSINLDNRTFRGPPRRHRGPFFCDFEPFWARLPPPPPPGKATRTEHSGSRDTGLPSPNPDRHKTIPDSVVTFFPHSRTPVAVWPARGPAGLVACCLLLLACLLNAQAPPKWPKNMITWLKYYVVQLSDPNPNHSLPPLPPLPTSPSGPPQPPHSDYASPDPRFQLPRPPTTTGAAGPGLPDVGPRPPPDPTCI